MRVTSIIILVAIIGFAAYLFIARPVWFTDLIGKAKNFVDPPAKTPTEAAERYCKAMNDRNYDSAAVYCKGNYGEALKKANDACIALGQSVDTIRNLAEKKGILNDESRFILDMLDPSPGTLKVKEVGEPKDGKAKVVLEVDLFNWQLSSDPTSAFDKKMFTTVLTPSKILTIDAVEVGEGEEKQWKLDLPLSENHRSMIDHYIKNHRSYVTELDGLAVHLRASGGITNKKELVSELKKSMTNSK